MVKSTVIVIDTVAVQTHSCHSVVSLGMPFCGTFPCLVVLARSFKFQSYNKKDPWETLGLPYTKGGNLFVNGGQILIFLTKEDA